MKRLAGLACAGAMMAAAGMAAACEKPAGAAKIEAELAGWINAERAKKGLSKLGVSAALGSAAQSHACDMAKRGYFEHDGPGGPSFTRRLNKSGYDYSAAVENLAASPSGTATEVAGQWRKSALHWKNLTHPKLDDMGIGIAVDGQRVLFVFVGAGN